jgi:hypothetical protein
MRDKMQKIYTTIVKFLGSKTFFWLIIVFFILESLWIALSFRFPMIYDEAFHVPLIRVFSHQWSPIINNQPLAYDHFGDLAHQGSLFYHYLMSFPYRLISLFSSSQEVQVITLRVLNILMGASGLIIFMHLFKRIGIKRVHTNIALLIFVLLPIVPFVAATINYDNMLFLLTAPYLLICVRLIKTQKVSWYNYVNLILVGCFASLVKFTFLPIFAASVLYLSVVLFRRHGKKMFSDLARSFGKSRRPWQILAALALIFFVGMFSLVYVQNMVRYGDPDPPCVKTLSQQRCLASGPIARNIQAAQTKNERPTEPFPAYANRWFNNMLLVTDFSGANTAHGAKIKSPLSSMNTLVFCGVFASVGTLLYAWRSVRKNDSWYFLLTIVVVLVVVVFFDNYSSYLKLHAAYAIQPRYLLSILPIVLVMMVVAAGYILRKLPYLKLASLIAVLLLFTQGGGAITHIVLSDDTWYWQNSTVIKANHAAKKVLRPLIKGV